MTLGTATTLSGPNVIRAFLGELVGYLMGAPDNSVDGEPQEIVESVLEHTDRFTSCSQKSLDDLKRQLVMAIHGHHNKHNLHCEMLGLGRVRVWIA